MFANFPLADFWMIAAIADTHTILWYLYADSRLGSAASFFLRTPW
jgi:hypothetical protein